MEALTRLNFRPQAVALAASAWVAASLAIAGGMLWWQAGQVGGLGVIDAARAAPALGLAAASFGLRSFRWHLFASAAGAHPSLLTSLRTQLIGFSLTMTPGKVGEIYKCYLMELRTGVPAARMAPAILFEKLLDAMAFAGLALAAAVLLPGIGGGVVDSIRGLLLLAAVAAVLTVAVRVISPEMVSSVLLRIAGRSGVGRRVAEMGALAMSGSAALLNPGVLGRNLALSFAARACDSAVFTLCVWAMGIDIPALATVFVFNSSGVLGGASMLPGGVGVVEASMSLLLTGFGAAAPAALAATMAARLLTFWLWVSIGLLLLLRSGFSVEAEPRR